MLVEKKMNIIHKAPEGRYVKSMYEKTNISLLWSLFAYIYIFYQYVTPLGFAIRNKFFYLYQIAFSGSLRQQQ
jgi:hypothetical protein